MPENVIKKVYFVRHGETVANHLSIHQGPEEPLNETGHKQAKQVVTFLRGKAVDTLLTSPYTRARETAEIVGEGLDLPLSTTSSVVEFRRPNFLYGKSHYSISSLIYIIKLFVHQSDYDWDYDGAENLIKIRNRIEDTKKEISELNGKSIIIVSHAVFMDMFTEMICADRPLRLREFVNGLIMTKRIPNTGIIEFSVDTLAPNGTCRWWLSGIYKPDGTKVGSIKSLRNPA